MPPRARFLLLAAVLAWVAGLAQAQTVIAIGGALKFDNQAVWQRIVAEAGGPGARFAVFATAAGHPERSAQQIIEALTRQGALAEFIPVAPRLEGIDLQQELASPGNLARVRAAQAVFFSGGAQALIVDTLQPGGRPTALLQAIWALYERGGVVAGTSAGAAIMSSTMFRDAPDTLQVLRGRLREGREIDRGLGFVGPELFIDQHFLKRGRVGRMLPLMLAKGYRLGLGIDEDSAAIIKGQQIEVIGSGGVLLVDLSHASRDAAQPVFNLRGALLSYLEHGDRHDLGLGVSTPGPRSTAAPAADPRASGLGPSAGLLPFYPDMLGDGTLVQAMGALLDSPRPEVRGLARGGPGQPGGEPQEPGFEFRLYKTAETRGRPGAAGGAAGGTVLRMGLDVSPVPIGRTEEMAR